MTKVVDKRKYIIYLKKAEDFIHAAEHSLKEDEYDPAVSSAVHSAINASDSLSVFYSSKRHDGKHEDALDTIKGILSNEEYKEISKQYSGLIELKNEAEYQPYHIGASHANDAVRRASRILTKVKGKLPASK